MQVKSLAATKEIIANDGCRLRELLHPDHDPALITYSLAIAWVDPGQSTHPHALRQTEVYYIIRGTGIMHIGQEHREVGPGDAIVIPPGHAQWIENRGPQALEFAALVSPPWRMEDDRRVPMPGRG